MAKKKQEEESIKDCIESINKECGVGTVLNLGDVGTKLNVECISTGILSLDIATGGGFPRGRSVEVFGAESTGKTLLALHTIASVQSNGGVCAIIDAEHAFDPEWARIVGVNLQDLYICQPSHGEEAIDVLERFVKSGSVDFVLIDSIAALIPIAELSGEVEDQHIGNQARMMGKMFRRLTGVLNKTKTVAMFINQIREKIGGMGYGPQTTTPGGRAAKFYTSQRIELHREGQLKKGEEVYGIQTGMKVVKNKIACPFKKCTVELIYGVGFCKHANVLSLAVDAGLVTKGGSWIKYKDNNIQGDVKFVEWLKQNPHEFDELTRAIKEHHKINN